MNSVSFRRTVRFFCCHVWRPLAFLRSSSYFSLVNEYRFAASKSVLLFSNDDIDPSKLATDFFASGNMEKLIPHKMVRKAILFPKVEPADKNLLLLELIQQNYVKGLISRFASNYDLNFNRSFSVYPHLSILSWQPGKKKNKRGTSRGFTLNFESANTTFNLRPSLLHGNSIRVQLDLIQDVLRVSDSELKLHFFVSFTVQSLLKRIVSNSILVPFGSVLTGFGSHNSDIDADLQFTNELFQLPEEKRLDGSLSAVHTIHQRKDDFRVKFLRCARDLVDLNLPFVANTQIRPHARVPLLRFDFKPARTQVDITVHNELGVKMSSKLYALNQLAPGVSKLMYFLRLWLRVWSLTFKDLPSSISHFVASMLMVAFLQGRGLLPPFADIPEDVELPASRGITRLEQPEDLVIEFLIWLASTDFRKTAFDIRTGKQLEITRYMGPSKRCLFLMNPLDPMHNMARNVRIEWLDLTQRAAALSLKLFKDSGQSDFLSFLLPPHRFERVPLKSEYDNALACVEYLEKSVNLQEFRNFLSS